MLSFQIRIINLKRLAVKSFRGTNLVLVLDYCYFKTTACLC